MTCYNTRLCRLCYHRGSSRLSVEQAARGYTLGGAYASYEENVKGSIRVGKYADFAVLGEDLFSIPPARIREVPVKMTVLAGEVVYRA